LFLVFFRIAAVDVNGGGTSIAYVLDEANAASPNDPAQSSTVYMSCTGSCGSFPAAGWVAVTDDASGHSSQDLITILPGPPAKIKYFQRWGTAYTDGGATEPMTGQFEVCFEVFNDAWVNKDGMYVHNGDGSARTRVQDLPAVGATTTYKVCFAHGETTCENPDRKCSCSN